MVDDNKERQGGPTAPPQPSAASQASRSEYWKKNLTVIGICLGIWAFVSLVLGVLLGPTLNDLGSIGGYPLGFFIAQQGSIYVFLALIFFYAWYMNRLDRKYGVEED